LSSRLTTGLAVAALHAAIVTSLGVKLAVDRATHPRVWVRTAPVDPDLPIRGRYVRMQIEAAPSSAADAWRGVDAQPVALRVEDGRLVAAPSPAGLYARLVRRTQDTVVVPVDPIAYFIPERAPDPSRRAPGEELWVEVTVPARGLPRPIRLGVKKSGAIVPLEF